MKYRVHIVSRILRNNVLVFLSMCFKVERLNVYIGQNNLTLIYCGIQYLKRKRFTIFFGEWSKRRCLTSSTCWSRMWWLTGCVSSVVSPMRIVSMLCGYVTQWRLFGCLIKVFLLCSPSIFPILPMLFCFCIRRLLLGWWSISSWLHGEFGRIGTGSGCGSKLRGLGRCVDVLLICWKSSMKCIKRFPEWLFEVVTLGGNLCPLVCIKSTLMVHYLRSRLI